MLPVSPGHRSVVRMLFAAIVLLVLVSGIAIGLAARQYAAGAAPVADISACVNKHTGVVRMNPYGRTSCSVNETQVVWSASDALGLHDPYRANRSVFVLPDSFNSVIVECNPGDVAIGGGFNNLTSSNLQVTSSVQGSAGNTWVVSARNLGLFQEPLRAQAICGTP